MLPNFLVIGAEKAGTTWLYEVLRQHPHVFLPDTKELCYFNRLDSNLQVSDYFHRLDRSWYEEFFSEHRNQPAIGDVSPMYLCDDAAPARIAATLPGAKLIAILRDPVERAHSHYWMARNKEHLTESFAEVIARKDEAVIKRGLYGEQLEVYFSLFSPSQILILIFEEVMADRREALARVCRFIGVDEDGLSDANLDESVNPATAYRSAWLYNASVTLATRFRQSALLAWLPRLLKKTGFNAKVKSLNAVDFRKPPLTEEERAALRQYYAGDRERLERLLGRKIEAWPR